MLVAIAAAGGVLLLVVLAKGAQELLAWALLCVGGTYTLALVVHGGRLDDRAPLVAACLLLCAELATWSLDERLRVAASRELVLRRAAALGALVIGGALAAGLVLAFAVAPVGGGLAWTALGALASVAVVALAVRLAR
ncbi:MAG: hypothetical protein ACYDCH_05125 [Gaiellaceae bacterium]